jgi:hypothetical protein
LKFLVDYAGYTAFRCGVGAEADVILISENYNRF